MAPRISVTIPPMTKIAAMIHRIVATPPTVPRWNRKQIHVALPFDGADRPLPAEPQAQASEALDLVQAGDRTGGSRWDRRSRSRFKPRSAGITSLVEERASEARSQRGVGTESPSQARMHRRLRGRLPLGGLLGAIAGAMVGAVVGLLFFDRSAAILTSILASTVFGLGVGMLVAGYSSLESPDPGAEPSDTARPVTDRPEVVREEHPDPPVRNQMPED